MTTSSDSIPLKRCSKGNECIHPMGCMQPATPEHFQRNSSKRDGLMSQCKTCAQDIKRRRYKEDPERVLRNTRRWNQANPEKAKQSCRTWYAANREKKLESSKRQQEAKPHLGRAKQQRRRARKHALSATLTHEQWTHCLEWWNHTCAYCGAQQSFWHILEQEHVVSVATGGEYTALNIVPACKSCNASKRDMPIDEWLKREFTPSKAKQTQRRIDAYFTYIKQHIEE